MTKSTVWLNPRHMDESKLNVTRNYNSTSQNKKKRKVYEEECGADSVSANKKRRSMLTEELNGSENPDSFVDVTGISESDFEEYRPSQLQGHHEEWNFSSEEEIKGKKRNTSYDCHRRETREWKDATDSLSLCENQLYDKTDSSCLSLSDVEVTEAADLVPYIKKKLLLQSGKGQFSFTTKRSIDREQNQELSLEENLQLHANFKPLNISDNELAPSLRTEHKKRKKNKKKKKKERETEDWVSKNISDNQAPSSALLQKEDTIDRGKVSKKSKNHSSTEGELFKTHRDKKLKNNNNDRIKCDSESHTKDHQVELFNNQGDVLNKKNKKEKKKQKKEKQTSASNCRETIMQKIHKGNSLDSIVNGISDPVQVKTRERETEKQDSDASYSEQQEELVLKLVLDGPNKLRLESGYQNCQEKSQHNHSGDQADKKPQRPIKEKKKTEQKKRTSESKCGRTVLEKSHERVSYNPSVDVANDSVQIKLSKRRNEKHISQSSSPEKPEELGLKLVLDDSNKLRLRSSSHGNTMVTNQEELSINQECKEHQKEKKKEKKKKKRESGKEILEMHNGDSLDGMVGISNDLAQIETRNHETERFNSESSCSEQQGELVLKLVLDSSNKLRLESSYQNPEVKSIIEATEDQQGNKKCHKTKKEKKKENKNQTSETNCCQSSMRETQEEVSTSNWTLESIFETSDDKSIIEATQEELHDIQRGMKHELDPKLQTNGQETKFSQLENFQSPWHMLSFDSNGPFTMPSQNTNVVSSPDQHNGFLHADTSRCNAVLDSFSKSETVSSGNNCESPAEKTLSQEQEATSMLPWLCEGEQLVPGRGTLNGLTQIPLVNKSSNQKVDVKRSHSWFARQVSDSDESQDNQISGRGNMKGLTQKSACHQGENDDHIETSSSFSEHSSASEDFNRTRTSIAQEKKSAQKTQEEISQATDSDMGSSDDIDDPDFVPKRPRTVKISENDEFSKKKSSAPFRHKCTRCNVFFGDATLMMQHECKSRAWRKKAESPLKKNALFRCPDCGRSYTQKCHLYLHQRSTHLGIKPYRCDECSMAFPVKQSLVYHKRMHSGSNPFKCRLSKCGSAHKTRGNLHKHYRSHHYLLPKYHCQHCDLSYYFNDELKQHVKVHEKKKRKKKGLSTVKNLAAKASWGN